jgi:Rrf2 family protein
MLSKKAKYALNALVHLSRKNGQGPVLISTISEDENIPRKFLESILLDLSKAGYVASKKGRGGGYYLIKEPKEINTADILRFIDGPIALLPCVTTKFYQKCEECHDEETCGIRDLFSELRESMVNLLKSNSLEDILNRESELLAPKK